MLTDFGPQPSETNFNFSASNAVVVRVIPLGSGIVHILPQNFNMFFSQHSQTPSLQCHTLNFLRTPKSDSGFLKKKHWNILPDRAES